MAAPQATSLDPEYVGITDTKGDILTYGEPPPTAALAKQAGAFTPEQVKAWAQSPIAPQARAAPTALEYSPEQIKDWAAGGTGALETSEALRGPALGEFLFPPARTNLGRLIAQSGIRTGIDTVAGAFGLGAATTDIARQVTTPASVFEGRSLQDVQAERDRLTAMLAQQGAEIDKRANSGQLSGEEIMGAAAYEEGIKRRIEGADAYIAAQGRVQETPFSQTLGHFSRALQSAQTAVAGAGETLPTQIAGEVPVQTAQSAAGAAAQIIGQVGAAVPLMAVDPATAATIFGAQSFQNFYADAKSHGASDRTAAMGGLMGASLGPLQAGMVGEAPISSAIAKDLLANMLGGQTWRRAMAELTTSAVRGGVINGGTVYLQNVAARLQGYDPNRPLDQGVYAAALTGAGIDTVTTLGHQLLRRAGQNPDRLPSQSQVREVPPPPVAPVTETPAGIAADFERNVNLTLGAGAEMPTGVAGMPGERGFVLGAGAAPTVPGRPVAARPTLALGAPAEEDRTRGAGQDLAGQDILFSNRLTERTGLTHEEAGHLLRAAQKISEDPDYVPNQAESAALDKLGTLSPDQWKQWEVAHGNQTGSDYRAALLDLNKNRGVEEVRPWREKAEAPEVPRETVTVPSTETIARQGETTPVALTEADRDYFAGRTGGATEADLHYFKELDRLRRSGDSEGFVRLRNQGPPDSQNVPSVYLHLYARTENPQAARNVNTGAIETAPSHFEAVNKHPEGQTIQLGTVFYDGLFHPDVDQGRAVSLAGEPMPAAAETPIQAWRRQYIERMDPEARASFERKSPEDQEQYLRHAESVSRAYEATRRPGEVPAPEIPGREPVDRPVSLEQARLLGPGGARVAAPEILSQADAKGLVNRANEQAGLEGRILYAPDVSALPRRIQQDLQGSRQTDTAQTVWDNRDGQLWVIGNRFRNAGELHRALIEEAIPRIFDHGQMPIATVHDETDPRLGWWDPVSERATLNTAQLVKRADPMLDASRTAVHESVAHAGFDRMFALDPETLNERMRAARRRFDSTGQGQDLAVSRGFGSVAEMTKAYGELYGLSGEELERAVNEELLATYAEANFPTRASLDQAPRWYHQILGDLGSAIRRIFDWQISDWDVQQLIRDSYAASRAGKSPVGVGAIPIRAEAISPTGHALAVMDNHSVTDPGLANVGQLETGHALNESQLESLYQRLEGSGHPIGIVSRPEGPIFVNYNERDLPNEAFHQLVARAVSETLPSGEHSLQFARNEGTYASNDPETIRASRGEYALEPAQRPLGVTAGLSGTGEPLPSQAGARGIGAEAPVTRSRSGLPAAGPEPIRPATYERASLPGPGLAADEPRADPTRGDAEEQERIAREQARTAAGIGPAEAIRAAAQQQQAGRVPGATFAERLAAQTREGGAVYGVRPHDLVTDEGRTQFANMGGGQDLSRVMDYLRNNPDFAKSDTGVSVSILASDALRAREQALTESGNLDQAARVQAQIQGFQREIRERSTQIAQALSAHQMMYENGDSILGRTQKRIGDIQARKLDGNPQVAAAQGQIADMRNGLVRQAVEQLGPVFDSLQQRLDAMVRGAIRDLPGVNIRSLAQQSLGVRDRIAGSISDSLIRDAGLAPDQAVALERHISDAVNRLVAGEQQRQLAAILAKAGGNQNPQRTVTELDRMMRMLNIGAFSKDEYYNAIRERFGLPGWSQEMADGIRSAGDRLQEIQAEAGPHELMEQYKAQIADHLMRAEPTLSRRAAQARALWYAGLLTGPTTHIPYFMANGVKAMIDLTMRNLDGFTKGEMTPKGIASTYGVAAQQLFDSTNWGEAWMTLRTGYRQQRPGEEGGVDVYGLRSLGTLPRRGGLEALPLPGGMGNPLNWYKYVPRALEAVNGLFYRSASEAVMRNIALREAQDRYPNDPELGKRWASEAIFGSESTQAEAQERASREALTYGWDEGQQRRRVEELIRESRPPELSEEAHRFALHAFYRETPIGSIGSLAHWVQDQQHQKGGWFWTLAVPFTNIAGNVANEALNWTPMGWLRGRDVTGLYERVPGMQPERWSPRERAALQAEYYWKANIGATLVGGLGAYLVSQLSNPNPWFNIHGAGPSDQNEKNAWLATGARPFTLQFGDRYLRYADWPIAIPLGALGQMGDVLRYDEPRKVAKGAEVNYATDAAFALLSGGARVLTDHSFLQSVSALFQMLSGQGTQQQIQVENYFANLAASFERIPLGGTGAEQVYRMFDSKTYETKSVLGKLFSQVPFAARAMNLEPKLNAFGEPVDNNSLYRILGYPGRPEPVYSFLSEHNIGMSMPQFGKVLYPGTSVPLSMDQFQRFTVERGQYFKQQLSENLDYLRDLEPEELQKEITNLEREATDHAKDIIADTYPDPSRGEPPARGRLRGYQQGGPVGYIPAPIEAFAEPLQATPESVSRGRRTVTYTSDYGEEPNPGEILRFVES